MQVLVGVVKININKPSILFLLLQEKVLAFNAYLGREVCYMGKEGVFGSLKF